MEEGATSTKDDESKKKTKRNKNKNYAVKKRPPVKPVEGHNVVFLTRKTNFKAQLEKCTELLTKGEKEIILHALGPAMQRCCNLAIQLQLLFPETHEIEVNTSTVSLVDDLYPRQDDIDYDMQYRLMSGMHIRIFRTAMVAANQ